MSEDSEKSGLIASVALHAALLAMLVVGFSRAPKFEDATESIPVETITSSQANEIMNGEKEAKPAKVPTPPAKAAAAEPPPPTPAPPTPPEPPPDLRKVEETPPPPPPMPAPPPPPPKPVPPPPPRPVADDAPTPPVKPKIVEKPPEKPREVEKAEKPEKPKTDDVAKLLAKEKAEEAAKEPPKAPAKPAFDKNAIAKLIGATKTADASPTGATAQGLPNQHAARMSPSLSAALDAWFTESYLGCWTPPPTTPEGERYVADVHVVFNPDGSLSAQPVLGNPPRDPAWRAHAESAVRAVLKCNPLRVPPQYAPYFEQWKSKTIHFDPQNALG